jgi:hypothetical protein
MRKQEHNYEIKGFKYGFRIIPRDEKRPILYVRLDKNGFWHFKIDNKGQYGICSLYNIYSLLESCVNLLYQDWELKKKSENDAVNFRIEQWAKTTTRKTLAKKLRIIWGNCCNNLDPKVVELHKKLFSVSKGSGQWQRVDGILSNKKKFKYVIEDMLDYPAARIAVLHSDMIVSWGVDISEWDGNWMQEYAFNDETYTSLNKTLMNLPYGVVYYNILALKNIILPEPATTRMRLWAYSQLARLHIDDKNKNALFLVLKRSTDEEIKNAIRLIWKYFPLYGEGKDNFRRHNSIRHALGLIFDYPLDIGDWDIIGLAKRSEKYHHDLDMQEHVRQMEWEKANQILMAATTKLPPVPLPIDENIKFLNSYKAVYDEGELMGHCIAQYAKSAVDGYCYLFHIDYSGEMASVEVRSDGFVNQAYGPRDTINKASEYGKKELSKWAKKLNENKYPQKRIKTGETTDEFGNVWEDYQTVQYAMEPAEGIPF